MNGSRDVSGRGAVVVFGTSPSLKLILVPRHPQRFDGVATLIEKSGFDFLRRSALPLPGPRASVILGDSMGEMFLYFGAADVAYVGGIDLTSFAGNRLDASHLVPQEIVPDVEVKVSLQLAQAYGNLEDGVVEGRA